MTTTQHPIVVEQGSVFEQTNIPFFIETDYEWVGEGFGARQEPMRERWQIGERETQYGMTNDGLGRLEVHVLEVVETVTSGPVAIYERRWFDPEGERLSRPRKRFSKVSNLRGFITRRKMTAIRSGKEPGMTTDTEAARERIGWVKNAAGVKDGAECYRTIGGVRWSWFAEDAERMRAAGTGIRCRRPRDGQGCFVHPDDENKAFAVSEGRTA